MASKKAAAPGPLPTLEELLTLPGGFALETATPVQRAVCRVIEGRPLGDLADDPDVQRALGGAGALTQLAGAPLEVYLLAGIRAAKSMIAAAAAVLATQKVDLSRLTVGETARVSVLSLRLDTAKVIYNHILGPVMARPALRSLLVGEPTSDTITLRHPSGRPVEIAVVAGAKAGGTVVARWSAGVIFDEAPRMAGDEAVVNFGDTRDAALGRLLPGAQLLAIGSPWAPQGPVYETVTERFGKPGVDLVVIRAPASVMNPVWWTPERIAAFRARPGGADLARTEIDAEFADPETSLFPSADVEACTRAGPAELPPEPRAETVAAMDPATRGNAWTLVVLTRTGGKLRVALARQWIGSRTSPLSPAAVLAEVRAALRPYRLDWVLTDQYSSDALRDLGAAVGLGVVDKPWTAQSRLLAFDALRLRLATRQLELPPDPVLRADLLAVRRRLTAAGATIALPTSGDGRHADYAPALALAASRYLDDPAPPPDAGLDDEERRLIEEEEAAQRDPLGWM